MTKPAANKVSKECMTNSWFEQIAENRLYMLLSSHSQLLHQTKAFLGKLSKSSLVLCTIGLLGILGNDMEHKIGVYKILGNGRSA